MGNGSVFDALDKEEMLRWSYRLFLGREPEHDDSTIRAIADSFSSLQDMRKAFLNSDEFRGMHHDFDGTVLNEYEEYKSNEAHAFFASHPDDSEYFMMYVYSMIVRPGDTVIDVGAHRGLHTVSLARLVSPEGIVYAFEAISELAAQLQNYVKGPVKVIDAAATSPETAMSNPNIVYTQVTAALGYSGIRRREGVMDE